MFPEKPSAELNQLRLAPDGGRLFAISYAGELSVWNVPSGELTMQVKGFGRMIVALEMSFDGSQLVAGTENGKGSSRMMHLDVVRGEARMLVDPTDTLPAVAVSADGHILVSATEIHRIRVWDLCSGTVRSRDPKHGGKYP